VSKDACIGSFIPVAELERIVISELRRITDTYLNREALSAQIVIQHDYAEKKDKLLSEIRSIQKRQDTINTALKNLYLDKVAEIIQADQYQTLSAGFAEEQSLILDRIKTMEEEISRIDDQKVHQRTKAEIIREYLDIKELNRPIVEKLIDYIEVSKRDPVTRIVHVDIHWNF